MTQTFARIANGIVLEVVALPDGVAPSAAFHAEIAAAMVACPSVTAQGQLYSAGAFSAAPAPAATQAQLIAYAGAKLAALRANPRSYALGGGVSVLCDSLPSPTGPDLIALLNWGTANPAATQPWVDDFGLVTTLTGAQAVTLATAVLAYGQALFAILAAACSGVAALTITATAQIDALSWPA